MIYATLLLRKSLFTPMVRYMDLSALELNTMAIVTKVGHKREENRLRSVGIRVGARIQVLDRTSSHGYRVKVDDTRLVLSHELAQTIDCIYR